MFSRLLRSDASATLADQATVSGGNFLTALVLARTLSPINYGVFSLLFLALFAINTCHSSLVIYPLTLRGAESKPRDLGRLTGLATIQTTILSIPLAACLSIFALILHHGDLLLPLVIAMLTWQLQETTRRALLSVLRARDAIVPDALCYLGQGFLLLCIRPQSLQVVFYLIAVTSLAAAAWQATTLRLSFRTNLRTRSLEYGRYSWQMGRYILAGNALNSLSLQLPSWTLAFAIGPLAVAGYQSLLNLVGIANPIIFSANNLLIPAIVRAAPQGVGVARKTALRHGSRYGMLLVPCFFALLAAPSFVMHLAYGAHASYASLAPLLRPLALAFAIQYVATVIGAYEGGMSRPQTYMWVQVMSAIALLSIGVPLILHKGIVGAVYAILIASVARLVAFALLAWTADRSLLKHMNNSVVYPLPKVAEDAFSLSAKPYSVQVCILTYRRLEQLRLTLESLRLQTLARSSSVELSIVVIDNDNGSALPVIEEEREQTTLPIHYLANSLNGLSTGRNLGLESSSFADYVAFIDDDEIASPEWLERLLDTAIQYSADVVTGPVMPQHVESPSWVVNGKFFDPERGHSGRPAPHVATNNTLISARIARPFRFDPAFNSTGGEDTDYFLRVAHQGFRMVWCDEAVVVETIPADRAKLSWILKRAYSNANRFTSSSLRLDKSAKVLLRRACVGAGGLLKGCALLPAGVFGWHHSARGLHYIARSAGTFAGLSGSSPTYYGDKS